MKMKPYTQLSKKEQGKIRYLRQQERYRESMEREQEKRKKDRIISSHSRNFLTGISGKSKPQREHVSPYVKKGRAMSPEQFKAVLDRLFGSRSNPEKEETE